MTLITATLLPSIFQLPFILLAPLHYRCPASKTKKAILIPILLGLAITTGGETEEQCFHPSQTGSNIKNHSAIISYPSQPHADTPSYSESDAAVMLTSTKW